MPGKYSDVVANACATTGTTAIIIVTENAHLRELTLSEVDDDGMVLEVELSWVGSPSPLKFVPNKIKQLVATNGAGVSLGMAKIPLDVIVRNATTVSIKCTANTAAVAGLIVGLRWD